MLKHLTFISGSLALVIGMGPAAAQNRQSRGGDQEIVMELHHSNQNEIHMGKMAQDRATSARVKNYAATLVRDHTAADQKLMALAAEKKMNMEDLRKPYDAMAHGDLAMRELMSNKGAAFNHAFAVKMVAEHQKAIDAATAAQQIARDPQLKAHIAEVLPTLRKHHATAQSLATSEPAPPNQAVQQPGDPSGVSRTKTGVDERRGTIP
jgi:putative membrane protein